MNEPSIYELILRVFAATIIGAAIGYEREMKNKPAGFFTFILVCVGSCLIAILQSNMVYDSLDLILAHPEIADSFKVDSGRIIAQVVSGIGFLGAGAIIHNKNNVKGITTAAMLWLVAALGLMIGTGGNNNYIIAGITCVIVLPISMFSRNLSERLVKQRKVHRIRMVFDDNYEKNLHEELAQMAITIKKTYLMNKNVDDGVYLKDSIFYISLPKTKKIEELMEYLSDLEYIRKIEEA